MTALVVDRGRTERFWRWALETGGCVVVALWFGLGIASGATVRLGVAAALAAAIVAAGLRAPRTLIISTMIWLSVMGVARRLLTLVAGSSTNDPLLLVAPCAVVVLVALAWVRGGFTRLTSISRLVQILTLLLLVSVINPLQGGLKVGLTGLLFTLGPMAWFWAGRAFVDDALLKAICFIVAIAGVVSAVYGLTQTLLGFSGFDQRWVDEFGYPALRVQGTIRAFGPFVSASDYLVYMGVAFVVVVAFAFKIRWTPLAIAAMGLTGWAIALGSGRGVVIQGVVALGMMLAASRRLRIGPAAIVGIALFGCLSVALGRVDTTTFTDPRTATLLAHQVQGLANPLKEEDSTLRGHVGLVGAGLRSPFENPFGRGVGVMSQVADKYGGSSAATESDPSNVAVGLGLPGLLAYVALAGFALKRAHERARLGRDALGLVALGVLIVTGLQWLNGGNYAAAPLPWLVLGWLDRPSDGLTTGESGSDLAVSSMTAAPWLT